MTLPGRASKRWTVPTARTAGAGRVKNNRNAHYRGQAWESKDDGGQSSYKRNSRITVVPTVQQRNLRETLMTILEF